MTKDQLFAQILRKKSFLCIGLDTDPAKIPAFLEKEPDPVFAFNKAIIDATCDYAVAYKLNTAFYEVNGSKGWDTLKRTLEYIPKDCFTIADAKRGDIGNTSLMYAKAFFQDMDFEAITVAPYMGKDSVRPFLSFDDKWVILLGLTSNEGASDFQFLKLENGRTLYQQVLETAKAWGPSNQLMFVVGATKADSLAEVRQILPDNFLLIPGVGAQGGDLETVARLGINDKCGLLVNVSRAIIFASNGSDFAQAAAAKAADYQRQMNELLALYLPPLEVQQA